MSSVARLNFRRSGSRDPKRRRSAESAAKSRWQCTTTPVAGSGKPFKRHDPGVQLRCCAAARGGPRRRVPIAGLTGVRPPLHVSEGWCWRHESEQGLDLFEGQNDGRGVAAVEVGEQRHVGRRNRRPRFLGRRHPDAVCRLRSTPPAAKPGNRTRHYMSPLGVCRLAIGARRKCVRRSSGPGTSRSVV